jgi:signal transduction histidine kinase/DNA-binding response OmpR family regulator
VAGETVLAVDDREDNLKFLREYVLEPNSYKMLQARNGADALQIALSQKVDLIISDLVMPKMGGLELLESLREKGLDIPAILMTFHGSEGTAVRAFRLGARDYIIKPFAIDEMLGAIDRALTESRLRQERDQLTQTVLQVNRQLENRVQEMRFLYGIGRSVTSLQNLEQVLNRIVEAAVYLSGAEEGSIMLLDPASGELFLRATRGMGEKSGKTMRLKVTDSMAGQVVRTGRPVMIGGVNQDDSFKVATGYFVKALLNVPLKVSNRVIGVLAVNNKHQVRAFTDRHLNLLLAMADYASIAIENARLYARLASEVSQAEQSSRQLEQTVANRNFEIQEMNQQLQKTEKLAALGYMAAGVAKEISTPINHILENLPRLNGLVPPTSDNLQLIATLEQDALRCQQITQGLRDFSGRGDHNPTSINLNDITEIAWSRYHTEANLDDQVRFIRGFDPYLPNILADTQQMEQAIFFLIRNAYQSMPQGGVLRIISRVVGSEAQLIISDTGRGLSPEEMRHIFDPFFETSEQAYGLGLSLTQSVIEQHRGRIEVDSEPGQGTTFTIHLPLPLGV